MLFHRGGEDGSSQHIPSERAHTPSEHLHSRKSNLPQADAAASAGGDNSLCTAVQGVRCLKPKVGRPGLLWGNLGCIWRLSSIHLSRPFSQGYSCTAERDGDTMGVSAPQLGCLGHFSPSCLSLWSDLQDPSSEQGKGCHHSAQVSLARWLLGTCISCSATGVATVVQTL